MHKLEMDLLLFTNYFPYKAANKEIYLEAELPILASQFRKVILFPEIVTKECRALPENVEVVVLDDLHYHWKKALNGNWMLLLKLLFTIPVFKLPRRYTIERVATLIHCFYRANRLQNWLVNRADQSPYICYSYWFYNWATTLGILRKKKVIQHFVSRAHANDLYEYVGAYNWIPHRRFQFDQVSHVFAVSHYGAEYLKQRYPGKSEEISFQYLGTTDFPATEKVFTDQDNRLHLVSCSNLAPVKRVDLIPEILQHLQAPFTWTHIGTGKELEKLRNKIDSLLPQQTVHLLGYKENSEIQAFYRAQSLDLFLNVSRSEGVPVSIMEAIAAGIPVVATNVGGTAEVVKVDFGTLLDKNFDPKLAAAELDKYYVLKQTDELQPLREKARQFWELNFDASRNYLQFVKKIKAFAN